MSSHTPDFIYSLIAALEANKMDGARDPPPNRATTSNTSATNLNHGCIKGMKAGTCRECAGRPPHGNRICQKCGNNGFVMSKCGACVRMGHDALVRLLVEKRAEWRAAAQAEAEAEAAAAAQAQAEAQAIEGTTMEKEQQVEEREDLTEGAAEESETEVDEAMEDVTEGEEKEVGEKMT